MTLTTRLARRRALPLPMVFGPSQFPDISQLMDDAFELLPEFRTLTRFETTGAFPAVNVAENPTSFTVTAELPGMGEKDVNVDFTDGVLTIKGQKTEEHTSKENGVRYHIWERKAGTFLRSFPFPGGIADDKISAEFKDGVLTIELPKVPEKQEMRRSIKINSK